MKAFGVVLVLLLGFVGLSEPVGAEEVDLKREVGSDGLYREVIDISDLDGELGQLQVKVIGGTLVGIKNMATGSPHVGSFQELSADSLFIGRWSKESARIFEVTVSSDDGNYSIETFTSTSMDDAFDFTDMLIRNGNFIEYDEFTAEDKDNYFNVYLEKGREYLYTFSSRQSFEIINPGGETLKSYPRVYHMYISKDDSRMNAGLSDVLTVEESGVYTFHAGKSDSSNNGIDFGIYEVIDDLSEIDSLIFNDGSVGQHVNARKYVVKANAASSYTVSANRLSENRGIVFVDIMDMRKTYANTPHYMDAYASNSVDDWYLYNDGLQLNDVYNMRSDVHGHLHSWEFSKYEEIDVSSQEFTRKTGDVAKELVTELNAEDRGESMVADPVDSFAGNFVDNRTLLSYSGNNPLSFGLSYDSIANESKSLGGGFTHNFETYVNETDAGLDVYWSPNSVVKFTKNGDTYEANSKKQLGIEVTKTAAGYKVIDQSKEIYLFDVDGQLITHTDKVGLVTTYDYSDDRLTKVSNAKGQFFDFAYNTDNQVSTVTDGTGRELGFTYTDKRLSGVKTPMGSTLAVAYAAVPSGSQNFKVSSLAYADKKLVDNTYDAFGRVVTQYDGNRNKTVFAYDEFTDDNRITTKVTTSGRTETMVHDRNGNLLSKSDGEGFVTKYTHDANRNIISETDKNGHVFGYEYDSLNRLVKQINPKDQVTAYEYDASNNVTKITTADGGTVVSEYDGGRLSSMVDKSGNDITYTYDEFGNVTTITRNDIKTSSKYDEYGYLVSMIRDGKTTTFENDGLGRVIKTVFPGDKVSSLTYDADNNVLTSTDIAGNTVTNEYNEFGNKVKSTDEKNAVTDFTYDTNGNLLVSKIGERETVYKYNAFNQVTSKLNRSGTSTKNSETLIYNKRGDLLSAHDADRKSTSFLYDGKGNMTSKTVGYVAELYEYDSVGNNIGYTDGIGNKTVYSHDSMGNVVSELSPSGVEITHVYDVMGKLLSTTDGVGNKTLFVYDAADNLIKITEPNGAVTQYEYNIDNQQIAMINALGERSESVYNELGQLIELKNTQGETMQTFTYNELGKVSKVMNGNGHTNDFTYDSHGNLLERIDALGNTVEVNQYNQYDELVSTLDALDNKTSVAYDLFGNISSTVDAKNNSMTYAYSAASRLAGTTDALGTIANNKYDAYGQISEIGQGVTSRTIFGRDKNQNVILEQFYLGSTRYAYNNEDDLIKKTNARSQAISYEYDKTGQVTKETTPEGVTTFTYDVVGNQLTAVTGSQSIARTYDLLGRVTSKTQNGSTIGYKYDKRGNLSKMTYPDGKEVDYVYDVVGNLLTVTDWNDKVTAYEYNANNQLVKTTNWNGTTEVRAYDVKGQLTSLKNLRGTEVISSYSYEYDANGNIVKENDTTLAYDPLNRLTLAGANAYTYSAFGNITSADVTQNGEAVTQTMTYGYDNEMKSLNGLAATVDRDGNLNKYSLNGKQYAATYDSKNRMTAFDGSTYRYDVENNRTGLTEGGTATEFVVDNDAAKYSQVLVETTGDSSKYHVYGNGLIGTYDGSKFETNHHDYRGSVTSVTDEAGAGIGSVSYDEYGVVTAKDDAVDTRFLYNGKYGVQTDANGLYHMRARYYNPDIKRFMNRDVVSGGIEQSQTLNRYAFVNGNPVSYNDPFGLAREAIGDTKSSFMDNVHLVSDIGGMIPGVGTVFNGVNAVIYISEGDYSNALLSTAGMIPGGGMVVGVAKGAKNAGGVAKSFDNVYNGVKGLLSPRSRSSELAIATPGGSLSHTLSKVTSESGSTSLAQKSSLVSDPHKYEVGLYNDIKGVPGLDAHHVGQKVVMGKLVMDYNEKLAPAINVPKSGHTVRQVVDGVKIKVVSRNKSGIDSARQLVARDIRELRRVYPDIPNSKLQELIAMNKNMYPEMRK